MKYSEYVFSKGIFFIQYWKKYIKSISKGKLKFKLLPNRILGFPVIMDAEPSSDNVRMQDFIFLTREELKCGKDTFLSA